MARFEVICCKVNGHGDSAAVAVVNRQDWTWFSLETEDKRTLTFDSEFKHLQDWCEEYGLTYVEKKVVFNVDFER